jgi:hypothetical protein
MKSGRVKKNPIIRIKKIKSWSHLNTILKNTKRPQARN